MAKNYARIIWSSQAEKDLDSILKHLLEFSSEKAYHQVNAIIDAVEQTVFTEQWQVDEYDPSCRRIIVKKRFRVYYKVVDEMVWVTRVYPTRKNPEGILHK